MIANGENLINLGLSVPLLGVDAQVRVVVPLVAATLAGVGAAVVAGGHDASATAAAPSAPPALRGTRLQVTPPAYTGQPASAGGARVGG